MILYFADRKLNIIGQASTKLPKGLTIVEDKKTEDVETGVAVFECTIPFDDDTRDMLENCASVGNYILRSYNGENEFYTIIDSETDTKKQEVYIYAEDAGLDLLNEIVGAYEADKAYSIEHYIQKFAYDSGFQIGVNQVASLTRKLSWDGEATVTERIASVATQFDGAEVSYSFGIDGMNVVSKYINIFKQRGKDIGANLRLNKDIDRIITKKTIMNLATCLKCTGGTPEDAENPINLSGYTYDDGDFFVDGQYLKSREAQKKWDRFTLGNGYIVRPYSYDTLSQSELCNRAISELKKLREMEVNYEVDIKKLPDNTKIGDRINIIDDAGNLYVSARVLKLETSAVNDTHEATLGEYLIKSSGISQKVAELAAQFAKNSASAARALSIANNAKTTAAEAQAQASAAATEAENAQKVAADATAAANSATQSAEAAQQAASNAQAAVDVVEEDVDGLKTTVANAQAAAEQAQQAAETAETKAVEAQQAATNAQTKANEAATAAGTAQSTADEAKENAETAQNTAAQAIADAEEAATTAAAAKLDAENAQKDIDALGENLTTLENTMSADYARKTDLTETEAKLQTQITQNAAEISSTATKVQEIDETANNAQEQAQAAQSAADAAQSTADQATADAQAAQTAADNAAAAATAAQNEADTAKAAAATAQSVADKAEADLEAAKADLATVTSRVDATEADITAAQQAVTTAQAAADKAKADATEAAEKATEAQSTADTAVTDAANAQTAANNAASAAALAQKTADEAKGDASAAQAKADEAATAAAEAQRTANTAVTNAENAQAAADQAAADAATAQKAADDADAKAAQAAADLATAQQNLADVTSRVDATEEEVAAAQQAVETAQAAADQAKTDAEAAQATADTAKANAATAQTAADNAKTAADNAQAAADEAQAAADAAQADVDALAIRVTTAETKITQNAEEIALRATKTEVTEALGGYSTTEEMEAAISVKANEITQTVSETYATKQEVEAIEIGGRNLVICKQLVPCYNYYTLSIGDHFKTISGQNFTYYFEIGNLRGKLVPGKVYTISNKSITTTSEYENRVQVRIWNFATSTSHEWLALLSGESLTFTIPDEIDVANTGLLIYPGGIDAFDFTIEELKLEAGNKATSWTPAPEDMATADDVTDVEQRVTNVESSITQQAEAIELRVTRTEVAETLSNYPTTDEMQATVDAVEVGGKNLIRNSRNLLFENYYFMESSVEMLYVLPGETNFSGVSSQVIDTGVKLFDTAKDFTIVVDATAVPDNYNLGLLDCAWARRADTAIVYKGGVEVKTTGSAWWGNGFRICGNPTNGAAEVFGAPANTTERTKMVVVYTQGIPSKWYYRTASATDITSKDPDTTSGVWDYVQHDGNAFIGGTMKNHECFIGTIHALKIYGGVLSQTSIEQELAF